MAYRSTIRKQKKFNWIRTTVAVLRWRRLVLLGVCVGLCWQILSINEQVTVPLPLNKNDNTNKMDNSALNENKLGNMNEEENAVAIGKNWCNNVATARSRLNPSLRITYPCEKMPQATSAVVCFLTAGVEVGKENRVVFTGRDYINGALALGVSLQKHITRKDTHQLLLIREGFSIPVRDIADLEAVGWTIGAAPSVEVEHRYLPVFQRYKTTYTKISAIGLSEYKCALLMDADTIAIGSLDDLLSCDILDRPEYHVAGTLDFYRKEWKHFNTGSILWRTSTDEMNRVYDLTQDSSFMRRFGSDQIFLNKVYPFRTDVVNNTLILEDHEGVTKESWGAVARLPWDYNAQTHVEVEIPKYWEKYLAGVKIIHYTQKKGWQCPEMYDPPLNAPPTNCDTKIPLCYCREGYRYWNFLRQAHQKGRTNFGVTKR